MGVVRTNGTPRVSRLSSLKSFFLRESGITGGSEPKSCQRHGKSPPPQESGLPEGSETKSMSPQIACSMQALVSPKFNPKILPELPWEPPFSSSSNSGDPGSRLRAKGVRQLDSQSIWILMRVDSTLK